MRVLIADGHRLRGAGIAAALDAAPGVALTEVVSRAGEVDAAARRLRPHVVLLALDLPGLDLCAALTALGARVVLLDERLDVDTLLGGVSSGAWGYLTGEAALDAVVRGVALVHAGEALYSRAMVTQMVRALGPRRREDARALERYVRLTRREREVLDLIGAGHDDAGIAAALGIAAETARWHAGNVLAKLGARSRNEAAVLASRLRRPA